MCLIWVNIERKRIFVLILCQRTRPRPRWSLAARTTWCRVSTAPRRTVCWPGAATMARSATGMTGQAQSMLKTSNRTESELAASLWVRFLSPQRTVSQCSRQCGSQARQGQSSSQPPQTARSVWVTCKHSDILNIEVLWWDTRNFTEPVDRLVLDPYLEDEDNVSRAQGASILEYEWTIPSKFMVGTQQGKTRNSD